MIRKFAAAAAACIFSSAAQAIDGVAIEAGRGDDRTNVLRVSLTDQWRKRQPPVPVWRLAGYWEVSAAVWDNRDESTADLGLTPVFRFERSRYYLEAAVGFHLVQTHISAHRSFSTAFQFADHLGIGLRSGKYAFGLRVQHISNGGVASPNPGINFVLARLQYDLE
jgi:lipid A 3-O-deacylase